MDLILLPGENSDAEADVFEAVMEKFISLDEWLSKHNDSAPDLYLMLPNDAGLRRTMINSLPLLPCNNERRILCLVPVELLDINLLAKLDEGKCQDIIFVDAYRNDNALTQAAQILATYRSRFNQSGLKVVYWLDYKKGSVNYRRYQLFQTGGDLVEPPRFGPVNNVNQVVIPRIAELLQGTNPLCAMANETIVINEKGKILFCPSSGHQVSGISLFNHTAEQLLIQKGRCSHMAGHMNMCTLCNYKGRFQWKKNSSEEIDMLLQAGRKLKDSMMWATYDPWNSAQFDMAPLPEKELTNELYAFQQRLRHWAQQLTETPVANASTPLVAIETPVFKGSWLIPCIESVLYQTSCRWTYYLLWDGGDELSRRILEIIQDLNHPKLKVFFSANRGIARARNFLTSQSTEEFIIPLDDDDMLGPAAVEDFIAAATQFSWSSIIRARRRFIDEAGKLVDMPEWFPFENRNYKYGMVTDLHNHCQPVLIRRSAYIETEGWEGFHDFFYAGEDCDIYLKLEEKGSIELVDKLLYFYRLNPHRTSHELKPEGAYEMWRRLADKTISRIGLPLKRLNERPPFEYVRNGDIAFTQEMIDFVIPFYDADEEELRYEQGRPSTACIPEYFELTGYNYFQQELTGDLLHSTRIELLFSAENHAQGIFRVEFISEHTGSCIAVGEANWKGTQEVSKGISFEMRRQAQPENEKYLLRLRFIPSRNNYATVKVLYYELEEPKLIARFFKHQQGYSKKALERCLSSLQKAGIASEAIYIIDQKQSSAANRNTGFLKTSKPFVCFLDDDVEIKDSNTFQKLLNEMASVEADLIGPRLTTPSGKIFCADPFFNEGLRPVPKGIGEPDDGKYRYTREVPWLPSTLFIVKREVLVATNGFDEGYVGSQMEDVDFCLKARQRNFKCVYAGNIEVVHYNNQRNDRFAENFERFMRKWQKHRSLFEAIQV